MNAATPSAPTRSPVGGLAAAGWRHLYNPATRRTDGSRGFRAMISFVGPLLLAECGKLPVEVVYAALAAQNIAMVDVRGAYPLRLSLLLAMGVVLAASAGFGGLVSVNVYSCILGAGCIALCGGLWRHLSSEYGMSLSISATLVFLLAESTKATGISTQTHCLSTLAGALWGVLIQVSFWPIRPEHPIRRVIGESWEATAALFDAMGAGEDPMAGGRHERVIERENQLRVALDAAYATLKGLRPRPVVVQLGELNTAAANMALAVVAFNTALEALMGEAEAQGLVESFQPALRALRNISHTVALAVVSQQPSHVATFDVRRRRVDSLLAALEAKLALRPDDSGASARLNEALGLIRTYLTRTAGALQAVVARSGERTAFSLELFDLNTWTLRPLATSLNLSSRVDLAIVRFAYRSAILMMLGVGLQKYVHFSSHLHLPHAYWLPFTMAVILQPDFGATRLRAGQRMGGTLIGSVVAGLVLWLSLPSWVVFSSIALTCFCFGYTLRRNYGVAVIFITLFVVLLTEGSGPTTELLTAERLGLTLTGGFLALAAAFLFWPVWEKERFGAIMAKALRANAEYLRFLGMRMKVGPIPEGSVSRVKQQAESANSDAFASLRRMTSDPKNQQEGLELAAAVTNGNQRLTRLFNLFTVQLDPVHRLSDPISERFIEVAVRALGVMADAYEGVPLALSRLTLLRRELDAFAYPDGKADTPEAKYLSWVYAHLSRASTELSALVLTTEQAAAEAFAPEAGVVSAATPAPG